MKTHVPASKVLFLAAAYGFAITVVALRWLGNAGVIGSKGNADATSGRKRAAIKARR